MKFKRISKFMAMMATIVAVVVLAVMPVMAAEERYLWDEEMQIVGTERVHVESYIKNGQHYAKAFTELPSGSHEYVSVSNTVIQYYDTYDYAYSHRSNPAAQDYTYAYAHFYLPNTHTCHYISSDHTARYTNFATQAGNWHAE